MRICILQHREESTPEQKNLNKSMTQAAVTVKGFGVLTSMNIDRGSWTCRKLFKLDVNLCRRRPTSVSATTTVTTSCIATHEDARSSRIEVLVGSPTSEAATKDHLTPSRAKPSPNSKGPAVRGLPWLESTGGRGHQ